MTFELSSPLLFVGRVDPFPDHRILCLLLCSGTSWKAHAVKIKGSISYQFSHQAGSLGEQDLAEVLQQEERWLRLSFLAALSYCISSAVKSNFSFNLAKDCRHIIYQMSGIYLCFIRNFICCVSDELQVLKMLQVIISQFTRSGRQSSDKQGWERRNFFSVQDVSCCYINTYLGPEFPH